MARLKTTDFAQRISGSIGGMTLRRHRGMTVAYAATTARSGPSITQHNRRTNFGQLSWRWSHQLTAAQRAAWDRIALRPETGRNLYIRENMLRFDANLGIRDAAPGLRNVIIAPNWSLNVATKYAIYIEFTPAPLLADDRAILLLKNMVSPAVSNPRTWTRQRWVQYGPKTGFGTYVITAPWQSGSRIYFQMHRVNLTQLASPPTFLTWIWPA